MLCFPFGASVRRSLLWLALAALATAAGCRAGQGRGAAAGGPSGGFTITERAENGPITAIALRAPYLWAAGAPGLRRWDLRSGEVETVVESTEARGQGITAIAVDEDGAAWVASASEVGRWAPTGKGGDELRYEAKGSPGKLTVLAVSRPSSAGVWAGGPGGLTRYDGRAFLPVEGLRGVAVTALSLDDDGRAVWAGTAGGGLFRAEAERARPVVGGESPAMDSVVGFATNAAGTRVVAGNAGGEARVYAMTMAGAEGFHAAGSRVAALVDRGDDALLIAGLPGQEQAYTLRPAPSGAGAEPGSLRFPPLRHDRQGRWLGLPTGLRIPAGVTVAAAGPTGSGEGEGDASLFVGTARLGVARPNAGGTGTLPGSELVGDANRLYVACIGPTICYLVTEGPGAWLTDGNQYKPTSVGQPAGAAVLALASDADANVYAISAEAKPPGLAITKHRPYSTSPWEPLHRVQLDLPTKTVPRASFAAVSPAGALWVGLRAESGGEDVGFGAVEIDLSNGHSVEHGPGHAHADPEALPLPAALTGIQFGAGVTWFSGFGGVSRFQEGQLRTWGENDGFISEFVHALLRTPDSSIWAATSEGLVRFDGANWRPLGSTELAVRGLALDTKGRVWVASNKGLRLIADPGKSPPPSGTPPAVALAVTVPAAEPTAPSKIDGKAVARTSAPSVDPSIAPVVLEGSMRDVRVDRYGRVWVMSSTSIALIEER